MKDPLLGEDQQAAVNQGGRSWIAVAIAAVVLLLLVRPSAWVAVSIVVGIILTVMLHEFGHFLAAKSSGMKVTEFFLGFGPRLWSFRRGETEYGVKAIPAGGYVRIIGMSSEEEVDPADEPRTYRRAPTGRRLVTVLAGITANVLIAYMLIFVIVAFRGELAPGTGVDSVVTDSPAATVGLRQGDHFVEIAGREIHTWNDIGDAVRPNAGRSIPVVISRQGGLIHEEITPENDSGVGHIGVYPSYEAVHYNVASAVPEAGSTLWRGTTLTVRALGSIFSPAGVEKYGRTIANPKAKNGISEDDRPRSVIGIVADGSQIVGGDVWTLLALLASINIFLALFNLIPLLPFDGGHAAIAAYEGIASRVRGHPVRVDYRRMVPVTVAVFGLLVVLGVSTMYLDIRQIITGS